MSTKNNLPEFAKKDLIAFEEDIAKEFNAGKIQAPIHLYNGNEENLKITTPEDFLKMSDILAKRLGPKFKKKVSN